MAWTTPRTWVTGEVVTASIMNTHVRDNLAYLKQIKLNHIFGGGAEAHVETGTFSASLATGAATSSAVTFSDAFASQPAVALGVQNETDPDGTNSPSGVPASTWDKAVSTTGFTLWIKSNSNSNPSTIRGFWIAVGSD